MGLATSLIVYSALAAPVKPVARPIHYESFKQGKVYFQAVVADMSKNTVTAETYYSDRLRSAWILIADRQPAAAITGTFFGYKSQQPVADVVVDGQIMAEGQRGSAVGVDWFGKVHIFDTRFEQAVDLPAYRYLLRGAVRLMKDGKVAPDPRSQHFTDSAIWGRAPRTAVGLTSDQRLVMMATKSKVTLSEMGRAMARLHVRNAVALDGGGSTMLYYRGSLLIPPSRGLSTLFILHERPPF